MHIVDEGALVAGGDGDDVVKREISEDAGLNLNLFGEGFPLDVVAGDELILLEHMHGLKHLDALRLEVIVKDDRARGLAVESALLGFLLPLLAVSVALEVDGLACLDILTENGEDSGILVGALADELVNASVRASATAVLSTSMAAAGLAGEPTARNSKRLPVKAKGLVRLRSVVSMRRSGI